MRIGLSGVLLLAITAPVAAHDFWIEPAHFQVTAGVPEPFVVQVGHGTDRQRWGASANRVVRFGVVAGKGIRDTRSSLTIGGTTADAILTFATPGTQVVVLETNHASSELPALRFNDYAKVEGLTPIIVARSAAGRSDTPGREMYSRRAKSLVQVGGASDPRSGTQAVGLTLEIVPQINPYALNPGVPLPVRIIYQGKPLSGATVKLNNLDFDVKPLAIKLTDARGIAAFDIPRTGRWQLNVVWSKPVTGNPAADFDTIFSSLTFGWR